ncbi:hypothetical protein O181_001454 [Austropuccinia psidii MF-1]|uniref:Uncharacterized protein n=1 Tax=Austropuccinia psidii MF-1 TaxID=1389203 RepID=A0A9Q3GBW1_9BASI|nr:hypothetical protein [Austropuccinia psidii MF-1]
MRDSFVGPFTIIRLIGKNAVEFRLTEEFSSKHPVSPVIWVKPQHQTGENRFPYRNNTHTPKDIVEVEDFPCEVKRIMKARKIRINGKNHRQYLVRFKTQTADKGKFLEDAIQDAEFHLGIFRASREAEQSDQ